MRANGIRGIQGYKRPRAVGGGPPSILAPNRLKREFTVDRPNKAWVTDITCIRTWQGSLYLAVVMDLYARRIVGWSMKPTLALGSLKKERVRKRIYHTRDEAKADLFDYIEVFYNRTRRHSHLGGVNRADR